jgi:hypothetical protein
MPENKYKEAEVCPHAKHEMTVCYHKDGEDCLTEDGCCPGCGWHKNQLENGKATVPTSECDLTANAIRYRRRALTAEEQCVMLKAERECLKLSNSAFRGDYNLHLKQIAKLHKQLAKSQSAYQRIFDEKAARCEYIAKLEADLVKYNTRKIVRRDGFHCGHRGCLAHITHPCEGCGRLGGRGEICIIHSKETANEQARDIAKTIERENGFGVEVEDNGL